ncbi:hypothetical protein [Arthrobacter sp. OY3WO11]|uniref:hypothetical protein n=1 Tax=Arthrobacter sp. OY3WO11 TaxID=1835723 RepID=UPI0007D0090A|nr:hypothetical protein [Arthrobacter sp. OY3WO11]OAD97709.1 hypothetical protein A6A22_20090 [Arthrobacter sp. OY3WO11]
MAETGIGGDDVGQDYYLLGAGFSRAISRHMPTLFDLQPAVLQELDILPESLHPFGDNLEEWMSYLSIEQPWVSDQDNTRNAAMFQDVSTAVDRCIQEAEARALVEGPPEWLTRLVWHWCDTSSAIATFNYDLLVERTATYLRRAGHWSDLYAMPLTERWPAGSSRAISASTPLDPVFNMFKLHGSTNWAYGGPKAPVSDRIVLKQPGGSWGPASTVREHTTGRYTSLFDDLVPLIIPPTSSKSSFYSNLSLRAQWRQAANTLRKARSLTIIGYSFPPSDLGARHFVSASLQSVPVTIVDYSAQIADRTEQFLGEERDIEKFSGEEAVRNFVDKRCGQLVKWGIRYGPEAWQPYVEVNGKDALGHLPEPAVTPNLAVEDKHALQWAESEVLRRWPTALKHAKRDHGADHALAHLAYITD